MIGLYATEECKPVDIDRLTEEEAAQLVRSLDRVLQRFCPLHHLVFLSTRLRNALKRNGLERIIDIEEFNRDHEAWTRLPGLGRTSHDELRHVLRDYGVRLRSWLTLKGKP